MQNSVSNYLPSDMWKVILFYLKGKDGITPKNVWNIALVNQSLSKMSQEIVNTINYKQENNYTSVIICDWEKFFPYLQKTFTNVTTLNLPKLNLNDDQLLSLSFIRRLQALNIKSCSNLTPKGIENLLEKIIGLTNLNIGSTTITDNVLTNIATLLTKLQLLNVNNVSVTDIGIEVLSQLTNLKYLNISNSKVTYNSIGNLTYLQKLNVAGCNALKNNISFLSLFTDLRSLNLGCVMTHFKVEDVLPLTKKPLKTLKISGITFINKNEFRGLSLLINLTELNIKSCEGVYLDEYINSLTNLKKLEVLYCKNMKHGINPLLLPNIKTIVFTHCDFDGVTAIEWSKKAKRAVSREFRVGCDLTEKSVVILVSEI